MSYQIEFELEDDGRWIAEICGIAGVMAYGITKDDAKQRALAIAAQLAW
jgi:predicted RNase H-like HicB family nuclease